MEKDKKQRGQIPREVLFKLAILIVSVFLIVYVLPREGSTGLQFREGMPWPYTQLIAENDFPIYKNEAQVQMEQDSIMADFAPYCEYSDSITEVQLKQIRTQLIRISNATGHQRSVLENTLRTIYEAGVLEGDEYNTFLEDSVKQVMIYTQKTAYRESLLSLYTPRKAYTALLACADTLQMSRNLLAQANLADLIRPNLTYDLDRSEEVRMDLMSSVSLTSGMVLAGTKIIDTGDIVTPELFSQLESWQRDQDKRNDTSTDKVLIILGQVILITIILTCFIGYVTLYRDDYFENPSQIGILFLLIVLFTVATILVTRFTTASVYIIPYAMVALIVRVLMDSRTAFMAAVVTALLSSLVLKYPFEFILIQTVTALVSIIVLRELSQRSQMMHAALTITVVSMLFYFGMNMMQNNGWSNLNFSMYRNFAINGVLLLFTYPLLYMLEKCFKVTSDVTYVELSSLSSPALKRLSEEAPGTFQHSMQVSNLAAEVVEKIKGKVLLVRTAALYHDIGKLNNTAFFTENQMSGVNPHDQLTEPQSAKVIIGHVTDGIKLAEKFHLPQTIKDAILTHHGKGMTKYFYITYKNNHPDEEVDTSLFTYPGPNPSTKEQAVLMMADSVEAASRSLKEYTEESISALVEKIIDQQMAEGYFRECPITFKDVAVAKEVFKERLKTIYHTRISYPELKK